ncbi:hypothetical protein HPB48_015307 [Haemaphysalis longicornis]|uniref:Decapping nuclease n=1 Tax=Haemaphysalis longicornis TaxID=44386 RepID=A0A9J6H2N2_HAELO|nr:hypothetical protein HPB48_015307 [Haemaphysalis longicornis]
MQASPVPGDCVAVLSVREAVSQSTGRFPTYCEPREVGCFSMVGEQPCWVDGAAMLKYLRMPSSPDQLRWDLNRGYETAVRWDLLKGKKIHNLLRWLAYQASNPAAEPGPERPFVQAPPLQQSLLADTDFVCGRGTLARIACTPYDKRNDWRLVACRHRGTIFLCSSLTDAYRQLRLDDKADPERDRPAYWGYKFEQFMAASETSDTDGSSSTAGYIELKTLCPERQAHSFHRFKLLRWWAQSFFAGTPQVICGFRDKQGIVHFVKEFNVREMPRDCKGLWSDAVCLNFTDQVLSFIKRHVNEDNPEEFYVFQYVPSSDKVVCTHLTEPGEFAFMPTWYLEPHDAKQRVSRHGEPSVRLCDKCNVDVALHSDLQ